MACRTALTGPRGRYRPLPTFTPAVGELLLPSRALGQVIRRHRNLARRLDCRRSRHMRIAFLPRATVLLCHDICSSPLHIHHSGTFSGSWSRGVPSAARRSGCASTYSRLLSDPVCHRRLGALLFRLPERDAALLCLCLYRRLLNLIPVVRRLLQIQVIQCAHMLSPQSLPIILTSVYSVAYLLASYY
jgi:hypothetical protein